MTSPGLLPDERIIGLALAFEKAHVPYAMAGAIGLVYWAEPRGTIDIDFNVFIAAEEAKTLFPALHELGVRLDDAEAERQVLATGQIRLDWSGVPLGLFFSYDHFHDSVRSRVRIVDFLGHSFPVISAEDLVVFKVLFNRPRDWADIEQVLATRAPDFDIAYARTWLTPAPGEGDSALSRLEALAASYL